MESRRDLIVSRKRKYSPSVEPETTTQTRQPSVSSVLENTPDMSASFSGASVVENPAVMSAPPLLPSILENTPEMTSTLLGPSELDTPIEITTPEMSASFIGPSVVEHTVGMSAPPLPFILKSTPEITSTLLEPSVLDTPTGIATSEMSASFIEPSVVEHPTGMSAPPLPSILKNTPAMTSTLLGHSELDTPTEIIIHPPILEIPRETSDFPHVPSVLENPDHSAPPHAPSSLEDPMEICALSPHGFSVLENLDHSASSIESSQLKTIQKMATSPTVPSTSENIQPLSVLEKNTPQMSTDTVPENPPEMEVLSVPSVLDNPSKISQPPPPVSTEMSSSHTMPLVLEHSSEMPTDPPEPTIQERNAELSVEPLATHSQYEDGNASTSSVDHPPSTGPENTEIPTQSVENNGNIDALVHLEIIHQHERKRPYFNAVEITKHFRFANLERIESFDAAIQAVHTAVQELLNSILQRIGPNDRIQLRLSGQGLDKPLYSFRSSNTTFDAGSFLSNVANMLQSNKDLLSNDVLKLLVIVVKNQEGGVKERRSLGSIPASDLIKEKRRWIFDFNYHEGNLCLAASVCALMSKDHPPEATLLQKAKEIHDALEIPANRLVSFSDIPAFEKHLQVTIKVLYYKHGKWTFFYTNNPCKEPIIFLLLHKGHYYGIKNAKGFCGYSYFCEYCNTQFHGKGRHSCKYFCKACHRRDCPEVPTMKPRCSNCRTFCRSHECLELHKSLALSEQVPCKKQRYCDKCCRYTDYNHDVMKCNGLQCRTCFQFVENFIDHQCFMRKRQPETSNKYIVYDCECSQENNTHVPNYIYALKLDSEQSWEFQGPDCLKDFRKTFIQRKFAGFSFIAHNAGRYDAYFVVQELLKENIKLNFLAKGGQLLSVTVADFKIRFIDSLNFLPMKLSKLPKAMGFDDTKGYFPHFFNTTANQAYVGPTPSQEYFGQENMMPDERDEFMAWYEENKNGEFNFQAELKKYCQRDVRILKQACICFRDRVMEMTMEKDPKNPQKTIQVDPFQLTTLASVCMAMFKFKFLPENTIAILPSDNYHKKQKRFSTPSIQWLMYIAWKENIAIKHALQGGEEQVGNYSLDGFALTDGTPTAFEFHGCFYHGCPQCYNADERNPVTKTTYGQLHHKTEVRKDILKSEGYKVREIWEHEWKQLLEKDNGLRNFLLEMNFPEPLEPRDALYGGRTNAVKLYHKAAPGEKIFYYDFTSLYPYVNKTKAYPVGHPVIHQDKFKDFDTYFGIAKVKVYPPKHLFFPVLPVKMKEKLVFPLCYTCASNGQATECQHCDEERALTGTWCTMEIQLALEKGYTLAKIYEVWHFEQQTTKLFEGYINLHLRDKQEASGYPSWCKDEEQRKKYISDYRDKEGVELREEHIAVNPARRQIAKLFLNSLWGKFGQKTNLPNTTVVSDPGEFHRYMFLPEYDVASLDFMGEETAIVHWKYIGSLPSIARNSNIFLACFTTAYARLQLYNVLDRLQERCLYHDTDSVIFISKGDEWDPPLGDYLGELTSELPDDTHITEFVSAGPKTYGYKLSTGKTCLKVKGITLNASTVQHLHFDSLKDLVLDFPEHSNPEQQKKITLQQPVITRDRYWQIETRPLRKTLKCVYTKRQLTDDFTTLPFGYRPQTEAQTQPGL
ncbi:uncharacterized protein LOC108710705 [Xenopus laevis]|uniref:DNA-directed DNA polymerase n=1 Tax=Xenopus laevis TaxID=8355 RepID=A0A8J0UH50_XENLA|nr:uncharacterized protein LOC108710705 [Xenopus laevis]